MTCTDVLALTFDDGPDPRWTPAVLAALAAAGARATFFVLGSRATEHPELVRRALAEGHAVELHGHGHLRHAASGCEAVAADLDAGLDVLRGLGVQPRLWRVPWGDAADWTEALASERGLQMAGWTVDTHDWRGDDAGTMLATCEAGLHDGAIVLAHDGRGPGAQREDCEQTVRLIGPLVDAARARGLEPALLGASWDAPLPVGNPALSGSIRA